MDDDTAGQQFCEEDIDQILEKRTQVITFEEEKGSSFSKASFSTAGNRSDIDIDDPDFWNKWAKRAEVGQDEGPAQVRKARRQVEDGSVGGGLSGGWVCSFSSDRCVFRTVFGSYIVGVLC